MTTTLCLSCSAAPVGATGHQDLAHHMTGPYPGHHIFRCGVCDERWIRHYGSTSEPFAWTRYSQQFSMRKPRPSPAQRPTISH